MTRRQWWGRLRRFVLAAATIAAAVLLVPVVSPAKPGCNTPECERRVQRKQCNAGNVSACLRVAARRHGVDHGLLRSIAWCESRFQARAINPTPVGAQREHATGVMQFLPSTFAATPYRGRSIMSAKWNTLAGAWLIRRVGTGPWTESRPCWG